MIAKSSNEFMKEVSDMMAKQSAKSWEEGYKAGIEKMLIKIKDSFWSCPDTEHYDMIAHKDCDECKEALGINVILDKLLQS